MCGYIFFVEQAASLFSFSLIAEQAGSLFYS